MAAKVLEGLQPRPEFRSDINRSERTVSRWIAKGMPVTYVGREQFIDPIKARAWIDAGGLLPANLRPLGEAAPIGQLFHTHTRAKRQ